VAGVDGRLSDVAADEAGAADDEQAHPTSIAPKRNRRVALATYVELGEQSGERHGCVVGRLSPAMCDFRIQRKRRLTSGRRRPRRRAA
jgi:hypothetical protein